MAKQFQSFADLIGQPKEITKLFESESDRGAVLILSAYLEEVLGCLIAASCVDESAANDILEFRGPAGGFDLKIRLCYAFGIIHKSELQALNHIRKIRNAAAHFDRKRGFNVLFDNEQTQTYVHNLAETQNITSKPNDHDAVRHLFFIACRSLGSKLYMRGVEIVAPTPPMTLKETANEIRERLKSTERGKMVEQIDEWVKDGDLDSLIELNNKMRDFFTEKLSQSNS